MQFSRGVEALLAALRNRESIGDRRAKVEELEPRRLLSVAAGVTGNSSVNEGQTYTLGLSGSAAGGTPVRDHWTINWADGSSPQTISGSATSATHLYADGNASLQISATLTASGTTSASSTYATASASKNITVNDVALSGSVWDVNVAFERNTFTLSRSYSDVAADPATKWVIDWGDGSGSTHGSFFGEEITGNPSQFKHVYAAPGSYSVSAAAYNKDQTAGQSVGGFVETVDPLEYVVAIDDNGGIMNESEGTLDFTLRRTLPPDTVETEPYSIYVHVKTSGIDDDIHNSADDTDYAVVMNDNIEDEGDGFYKITFDPNEDTATLSIMGTDDSEVETQEWFKVVITSVDASGHTPSVDVYHSQAFGGIDDDDQVVSIAVDDGLISEDGNTGRFVVSRGPDSSAALDVPISFSGAAVLGTDYTTDLSGGASPYVHFDEDETQVTFSITAIDDSITEPAESVVATLHAPGGDDLYTVKPGAAFASAVITDLTPEDPNSPTSLRAMALSSSDVELAWKLPGGGSYPDGFIIQRSTDGGETFTPYQQILDPTARSLDVSGLDPNTSYVFRVDAAIDDLDGNLLGDGDDIVTAGDGTKSATTTNDQWEDMDESVTPDIASGDLSYFNGGDDLPAGLYRLLYDGGAVNYDTSEDQSHPAWLAMDYYAASDGNPLNDGLGAQPNAGMQEGAIDQASLQDAEHEATPTTWEIQNPGGPIGVGFYNPSENYSGPGVTWRLQRYVPHISLLTTTAATTEGDDAHPAQLYFQIDDGYNGYHYNEPLTVKFDLSGSATEGDTAQYSAVMLIPDGNGGNTTQAVNLASGQFTIPADVYYGVEIDITANNDTVPEWTQDLNLRLKDDLPHYMVDHYVDFDGVDDNGPEPDPDVVVLLKDNDLSFDFHTGTLVANYNDSNGNGVTDYLDPASQDEDIDPDLYEMVLHAPTVYKPDSHVTLTITGGFFNLYDSQSKDNLIETTSIGGTDTVTWGAGDVPTSIWIEVKQGSTNTNDITTTLSATDHTDFSQQNTAVNFHISLGDNPNSGVSGDVTNQSTNWLVGQIADLDVTIDAPTSIKSGATKAWTIPGNVVRDYIIDDTSAHTVSIAPMDYEGEEPLGTGTAQPEVKFLWPTTAAANEDRTVSVNVGNINGQSYTVQTNFKVFEPVVTFGTPYTGVSVFNAPNQTLYLFGNNVRRPNGSPRAGIEVPTAVNMPTEFSQTGTWSFMQTVIDYHVQQPVAGAWQEWSYNGVETLDFAPDYPYVKDATGAAAATTLNTGTAQFAMTDTPRFPLAGMSYGEVNSFYKLYVMFKAPGTNSRSVPVRMVTWNWYAEMNAGALIGSSGPAPVPPVRVTTLPVFNGIVQNGHWI